MEVVVLGLELRASQILCRGLITEVFWSLHKGFENLSIIDNLKQQWFRFLVLTESTHPVAVWVIPS